MSLLNLLRRRHDYDSSWRSETPSSSKQQVRATSGPAARLPLAAGRMEVFIRPIEKGTAGSKLRKFEYLTSEARAATTRRSAGWPAGRPTPTTGEGIFVRRPEPSSEPLALTTMLITRLGDIMTLTGPELHLSRSSSAGANDDHADDDDG